MSDRRTPIPVDPGLAVEAEVRRNVLSQAIGRGTVADLNLPTDFVIRVTDRAIRQSFHERHRAVTSAAPVADGPADASMGDGRSAADVSVPVAITPALASFRSPESIGEELATRLLMDPLPEDANQHREIEPRRIVRQRLAREGLLPTLARVILHLGPAKFLEPDESRVLELTAFGLPMDLLARFQVQGTASPAAVVAHIARELANGVRIEKMEKALRRATFVASQSLPGFRPTSENGLDMPRLVRAQATRDTHYAAAGDGGCLDLIEGVLKEVSGCECFLTVNASHAPGLSKVVESHSQSRKITIRPQVFRVAQWAGDNAKAGSVVGAEGERRPAHLTPRFAARREDVTQYVVGDDHAVAAASIPTVRAARSPLVFEGGNLLVCDDPRRGDRVLLMGEAEIYRAQALGLSRDQAFEALRTEFACERGVILPAASYHIDQEVTARALADGQVVAFVPDTQRGVRLVLEACLARLGETGRWDARLVSDAIEFLRSSRMRECLTLVWTGLTRERTPDGSWPLALADALSVAPADSGVGNFHRFLVAADHLAAEVSDPSEFEDGHVRAMLRSLVRREQDRRSLRARIEGLGWKTIPVPALPNDSRGVNPLNGVQLRDRYLMPAYGGLLAGLDQAAGEVFSRHLQSSGVAVRAIPTGESQRREGALHCSLSVFGW